jgi:hypothetical protein
MRGRIFRLQMFSPACLGGRFGDDVAHPAVFTGDGGHEQPTEPSDDLSRSANLAATADHGGKASSRNAGVFDRTNHGTLRRIEMPLAFGAFLRIDDVHIVLEANGGVGTLELASATHRALRGDDFVGHLMTPARDCDAGRQLSFKPRANSQRFDL